MRIDVLTLFPDLFDGVLKSSILGRARAIEALSVRVVDFRDYATNRHRTVDDYPYGGGAGMVLKPEPLFLAVEDLLSQGGPERAEVVLLSPQGRLFTQDLAQEWAASEKRLILLAGHYEGFDERVREHLATDEVSIGDYILTGGELAALVVIDAVARLLPGVLGNERSALEESFSGHLLDYPQYTRPETFRGWSVPPVLLSGHHERIAQWRRRESLKRTRERRPDLFRDAALSDDDRAYLDSLAAKGD